ncbi:MAG: hypothetical protein KC503_45505, partial [Myxococcales bacterium]|nr:hypothetical protein [Myxococcales bacterium]
MLPSLRAIALAVVAVALPACTSHRDPQPLPPPVASAVRYGKRSVAAALDDLVKRLGKLEREGSWPDAKRVAQALAETPGLDLRGPAGP